MAVFWDSPTPMTAAEVRVIASMVKTGLIDDGERLTPADLANLLECSHTANGPGPCNECLPDPEKAKKIRWSVHAMHIGYVTRPDGRALSATITWNDDKQEYYTILIESHKDVNNLDEVFADHGHKDLGTFKTELAAKEACHTYIDEWRKKSAPAESCDCEEINEP